MRPYTLRFFEQDVERWKSQATQQGLSLSEWVRRQCNGIRGNKVRRAQTDSTEASNDNKSQTLRSMGLSPHEAGVPDFEEDMRQVDEAVEDDDS